MLMDSHSSRNNGVRPGSINSQGGGGAAGRGLPTGEGVVTSPFRRSEASRREERAAVWKSGGVGLTGGNFRLSEALVS